MLSESIWDNLVSNELYLWDTLHNYQRAASILSLNIGASDVTLARGAAGQLNVGAWLTFVKTTGQLVLDSFVTGDTAERFSATVNGVLGWGSGAVAQDTNLFRETANVLHTDDSFVAVGELQASRGLSTQTAIGAKGPAGEAGITFGTASDTNLYRSAADTLKTDDAFVAASVSATNVMTRLAETTLGSAAASISFTSIPATYKHLVLVVQTRSTGAVTGTEVRLRFNNDSGTSYTYQYHYAHGTTIAADGPASTTQTFVGFAPGTSGLAGLRSALRCTICDYASTSVYKSLVSNFHGESSSAVFQAIGTVGAVWASTVAINRIDVFLGAGNLDTGTTATLYGC